MCTLTILRENSRLLVTMNRDDIATREEAPPHVWPNTDPDFVAPRDELAGGTWIGVNRHGVIACLLNRYDAAPKGQLSRGDIVIEAMGGASIERSLSAVTSLDLGAYSPFSCLVIAEGGAARLDWTGASIRRQDCSSGAKAVMATSSSWRFDEVKAQREALFHEIMSGGGDAAGNLAAFHTRRVRADDAWAPMMLRSQSQTKSVTQIELSPRGAEMRYWTRDAAISRKLKTPDRCVRIGA
ncbi:MAG: NRDE family protein [Terricaulis sp.]